MPFQPGAVLYTQGFGSVPGSILAPHIDVRPPNPTDGVNQQFSVGKIWIDTVDFTVYALAGFQTSNGITTAHWVLLASSGGTIDTVTTSAGIVSPSAGNINLIGTTNQLSTSGSGSTATLSIPTTFIAPGSIAATTTLTANGLTTLAALTQVGALSLNSTGSANTNIGSNTAGTVNITSATHIGIVSDAGNVVIDSNTNGSVIFIGRDSNDQTISLGALGPTSGDKTVLIGSTLGNSTTTLESGTGGMFINPTGGGSINIGGAFGSDIVMQSAGDITVFTLAGDIFFSGQGQGDVIIEDADLLLNTNGSQLQVKGNSSSDFIGTVTLTAGVASILNNNILANDRIFMQVINPSTSTAIGTLIYTLIPGTGFDIFSVNPNAPGSNVTTDVSVITYWIVRQLP